MRYLVSWGTEPPVALDITLDYTPRIDEKTDQAIATVKETAIRMAKWYAMEHHAPARVDWQEYAFMRAELVTTVDSV